MQGNLIIIQQVITSVAGIEGIFENHAQNVQY